MDVDDEVMPAIEEEEEVDNKPAPTSVFIPGLHTLGKDEILEADDTVYEMRHSMQVKWPSLSFDILRDNLGDHRQRYPATAYIVAGTQARIAKDNELAVYKLSSLHRTQKDGSKSQSAHPCNLSDSQGCRR
jgi:ribosome assembly protein RRB1